MFGKKRKKNQRRLNALARWEREEKNNKFEHRSAHIKNQISILKRKLKIA